MNDKYRILLFRYLIKELRLDAADNYLSQNGIASINNEQLMCDEEKLCSRYSKYFYLLNQINTNNLNANDSNYLNNLDANTPITDELDAFLVRTYKDVLFEDSVGEKIYYGPHSPSFEADDDAIVIGFKRDEYGMAVGKLLEYDETEKQNTIVNDVLKTLVQSKFKIVILKYNELYEKMKNNSL